MPFNHFFSRTIYRNGDAKIQLFFIPSHTNQFFFVLLQSQNKDWNDK